MRERYRMYQRNGGSFYAKDRKTGRTESLATFDQREAARLLAAKNQATEQPCLNVAMAKVYLSAQSPEFLSRTWGQLIELVAHGYEGATAKRWKKFAKSDPLKMLVNLPLYLTEAVHILAVLDHKKAGVSTNVWLRILHNRALDLGWLLTPALNKRLWPKVKYKARRGITAEEHAKVLASEHLDDYRLFFRRLTEQIPNVAARDIAQAVADCVESQSEVFSEEPARTAVILAALLDGFPRYPKMHPCGMVLSCDTILDHSPTFESAKGYPTTHFDMDSVEAVGLVKLDILAQGGLAVMRDARKMIEERGISINLESLEPWEDPAVWEMIAAGNGRGVHHIESPAMITLSKMCNVRDIDVLIAIVSVIRPGAANMGRKSDFALRAQGLQEIDYTHPSLSQVLKSTFGVVAYEEHILQICEAFADMPAGRADILRRSLVKQKAVEVEKLRLEFWGCAERKGRTQPEIESVWNLLFGFQGYAFCRAHSTAYGVEAYQAAHLKRYYPAEFLSAVLSNEKGFYSPMAYTLEARRLGIGFLSPDVNVSREGFYPEYICNKPSLRVPLWKVKDLTDKTVARIAAEVKQRPFASLKDFYTRVVPAKAEAQNLIRAGAFDNFGEPRTTQFWHLQQLADWPHEGAQGMLFASADRELRIPQATLTEPSRIDRMKDEQDLLGFTVSGHPLDLFPDIDWAKFCPIADLGKHFGERVKVCGISFADRIAYQEDGQPMKFISLCDYSGFVETELFAAVYKAFGMETIKSPLIEVEGFVEPFENKKGFTLRVLRVRNP